MLVLCCLFAACHHCLAEDPYAENHEANTEEQQGQYYDDEHEIVKDEVKDEQQRDLEHQYDETAEQENDEQYNQQLSYDDFDGVDVSWPMHHGSNRHPIAAERSRVAGRHLHFLQGCIMLYSEEECLRADRERMATNYRQPPLMHNYTTTGFSKINKIPSSVKTSLYQFYDKYHEKMVREIWPPGTIYANHWSSTIKTLPIDGYPHAEEGINDEAVQPSLSEQKRRDLVAQIQPILEDWCKAPLVATGVQGIREYRRGAVVAPMVNRLPFVISVVINVGQDVVDDWPLQVIGHDGTAVNITIAPGEMVIYEGASLIHGRPYPLLGQTYSELHLHFEPVGYSQRQMGMRQDPKSLFEAALQKQQDTSASGDTRSDDETWKQKQKERPYYVPPKYKVQWEQNFVFVKRPPAKKKLQTLDSRDTKSPLEAKLNEEGVDVTEYKSDGRLFHNLAAKGFLIRMKELVAKDPLIIVKGDSNGWLALHEAARAGHTRVVQYLCDMMDQTEINTRTNGGKGGTPLWWALHEFSEDHPAAKVLIKNGARSIAPGTP